MRRAGRRAVQIKCMVGLQHLKLKVAPGRFTHDGIRKMSENPEDREQAAAALFREIGGRLVSYSVTLGMDDWPDPSTMR